MIIETSQEYFSISSFRHRALKHFVAIWATLPRQLWRPEVWKSIATFTPTFQQIEMEFWWKNGRNFWMPGTKLLSCPCVTQSLYNLFNTPNPWLARPEDCTTNTLDQDWTLACETHRVTASHAIHKYFSRRVVPFNYCLYLWRHKLVCKTKTL